MTQTAQQLFDRALKNKSIRKKLNEEAAKATGRGHLLNAGWQPDLPDYCNDLNEAARLKLPDGWERMYCRTGYERVIDLGGKATEPPTCVWVQYERQHEALARVCVWAVATGVEV